MTAALGGMFLDTLRVDDEVCPADPPGIALTSDNTRHDVPTGNQPTHIIIKTAAPDRQP
ncbi:hypothetical protein [Streptomyces albipurpureus]|uniref:Uncharacterized protein n=1 Tax=Streptomyces albipurpureus TaxID=2897419 RepID=A0ABT0UZQ3_9ACTN|nr:hypothetical protein [Streptomyces sp. CWNU-1]MCM2393575.1 hypothetical protein [Streptomyces sp. CWNU-1]